MNAAVAQYGPPLWDSSKTLSLQEARLVAAAVRILVRAPEGSGAELVFRLYGEEVLHAAMSAGRSLSPRA
jgi:hypothetical protein